MRFCEVDGEERPAPIDRVSLMDMASCRVTRTLNRVGVGGRGGCIKRRRRKKETRRVKGADFFFFFFLQRAQPVLHKFLSVQTCESVSQVHFSTASAVACIHLKQHRATRYL